jgi:hypothetical protein
MEVQTPPLQLVPAAHVVPHPPQFLLSALVLMQVPLQYVSPVGQRDVQTPLEQLVPVAHVVPHAPQSELLLRRSVHRPLQLP